MSTYLVYVDFQAGSGWEAVSGVIRGGVKVSEQAYNGKLKSTTNYAKVKVRGDATIVNALLTNTVKTKLKITKDGTTIFTGFVRKNFSFNIHHRPKYLEIEGVDLSILLEETKTETTFYEGKKVCDPADTANSLVHLLLDEAGVESSEIAAAITTISKTVDYFYIDARDKKTFRTVIDTILFEYGYVLYFDKTVFTLLPLFHSSLTSSHTFDDESTGAITIKKQEVEYEVVALTYYETDVEEDGICFNDTTGGDDTTDCNIELAAGEYYPEGASATDPVYSEYEQSGRTILFVKNAYLSETVGTGITVPRETMGYLAADVAFLNGAAAARYITKFKIFGDVYYQGAKHIIKIFNVAASQKIYELDLVYANNETDANSLLTGLASYLKNSTVKYSFSSPDDVAVGAIVTLDTDMLSASQVCKVIEKVQSDSSSMTDYVLIALSAYSAETIESENYHPGTVSSTQQDAINSAVTSMSDDEVVTPQEKIAYLTLWYQINGDGSTTGSYWTVKSQATALGLSTADLTAKYDALYAYLFTSPAVLGTIPGENVTIVPASWLAVWAEYYSAEREIQSAVNQSAIQPSQEGLEAYYSFDGPEVNGQTVDNSGNYIHADVEGPTQVNSAQGLAYDFDGTDDSIVTEEIPAMSSGLTLAAMVTPDTLNDSSVGDIIISHEDEPVYLSVTDAGTIRFSFLDDGDVQRVLTYAAGWVAGARHFVEAKHDGTTARIILDGVIVEADDTYALGTIPAGSWRIGAQTSSLNYPFDGMIDEVAIWSRALSYREDLGLWRVGGVQVKRYQSADETTLSVDGDAIVSQSGDGLQDMRLDLSMLRFRSRVSASSPWEEQAWMRRRTDSALFDLSVSGYGYGRSGLLSNIGMIWLDKTQPFTTAGVWSAAYGNGVWIAVGSSGKIAKSTDDGEAWGSLISNPFSTSTITGIAYGNSVWIAVGGSGSIARSTNDGASWGSLISTPFGTSTLYAVAYGNGVWIAVGAGGKIARSIDDGASWGSLITNPFSTSNIRGINYGNGVWVAVGDDGKIARSIDNGITWGELLANPFSTVILTDAAYGDGVWVAVGENGEIARSIDNGITWGSLLTTPFGTSTISGISFGNGVWVASGYSGKIGRSVDKGVTWIQQTYSTSGILTPFGTDGFYLGVAFGNDRFIAVGYLNSDSSGILCVSEWQEAGSGIVERGVNSNGSYIKFSDGTMVCCKTDSISTAINNARGSLYDSGLKSATSWPAEFISAPEVAGLVSSGGYRSWLVPQDNATTTSTPTYYLYRAVALSGAVTFNVNFIAFGRWK